MVGAGAANQRRGPLDPRLLRHTRASGPYLAASVLIGCLTAGLVIVQAYLLAEAVAAVTLAPLLPLAGIVAGRALLAWVQEVAARRASAAVKSALRIKLLEHAVRLGPGWLAGERKSSLTTLIGPGLDALDEYFARYLPQLVLAAIVPGAIVVVLLGADLIAGLTVALTLPLIPVFMVLIGMATQAMAKRRWRALSVLAHHFGDVVAGLPTLKIFGRAKAQVSSVRSVSDRHRSESLRSLRVAFLSALALELLSTLSVALVAVGIGVRLVDGDIGLRTALTALILAPEAYLPIRKVGQHYHASADGVAAVSEAFTVLETEPVRTVSDSLTVQPLAARPSRIAVAGLGVRGVRDLSFDVGPGEILAITGPSGAGKTSVLDVLLGFIAPDAGEVRIDGVPLDALDPQDWRRQIGWVGQLPYLRAGTIEENVELGSDPESRADPARVGRALQNAAASELTPDRLIGEGGLGLSVGERRRVALARALAREPTILLLDEPTAGLDAEAEAQVGKTLLRLRDEGRTILLVSHRPDTLVWADREVEL